MILWRAALAAAMVVHTTRAEAYAFGARYDLPLPLGLYLAAAGGGAVAVSFLGTLLFLRAGQNVPAVAGFIAPAGLLAIAWSSWSRTGRKIRVPLACW